MKLFGGGKEEISQATDTEKEKRLNKLNDEFQASHSQPTPASARDKKALERKQVRAAQALKDAESDLQDHRAEARAEAEETGAVYNDLIAKRERLTKEQKRIFQEIADVDRELEEIRVEDMGGKETGSIELTDEAA